MRVVQPWMLKVTMWGMGIVLAAAALIGCQFRTFLAPVFVVVLMALALLTGCESTFVSTYDRAPLVAGTAGASNRETVNAESGAPAHQQAGSPSSGGASSVQAGAAGSPSSGGASSVQAGAAGSPSSGGASSVQAGGAVGRGGSSAAGGSVPRNPQWPQCLDSKSCGRCDSLVLGVSQTCDLLAGCVASQHCKLDSDCVKPGGFCYPGPASSAWSCECKVEP